jgi:hypothetical protein
VRTSKWQILWMLEIRVRVRSVWVVGDGKREVGREREDHHGLRRVNQCK